MFLIINLNIYYGCGIFISHLFIWGRFLVSTDYSLDMVAGGKVRPNLPTQLNITDNNNYNTALAFA